MPGLAAFAVLLAVVLLSAYGEVRQITCSRASPAVVTCMHTGSTYFSSTSLTVNVKAPAGAVLRKRSLGRRSSAYWIALSTPAGEVALMPTESRMPSEHRISATTALDRFVRDAARPSATVTMGSRTLGWAYALVFAVLPLIFVYTRRGQRTVLSVDPVQGTLSVTNRVWPHPGHTTSIPLDRVRDPVLDGDEHGKMHRVVILVEDGAPIPIRSYTDRATAEKLALRIRDFLGSSIPNGEVTAGHSL